MCVSLYFTKIITLLPHQNYKKKTKIEKKQQINKGCTTLITVVYMEKQ